MEIILDNVQTRFKDSYAYSPEVGLALRSNGEERVMVITPDGAIFDAYLPPPTIAPVTLLNGAAGDIDGGGQFAVYKYVYANANTFPLVEADFVYEGISGPRSNPSPASIPIGVPDDRKIDVTVYGTNAPGISDILIFRSSFAGTSAQATLMGQANTLFYVGKVANTGLLNDPIVFLDNNPTTLGALQIRWDNYGAPQFQLCTYYDPYWYGIGNFSFVAKASWATTGIITLDPVEGEKWFDGRNGQYIHLEHVDIGGIDGNGLYRFLLINETLGRIVLADGSTFASLATAGSGRVIIKGPSATLYRSKARNPFAWGVTDFLESGLNAVSLFAIKVGGGEATAIATVPNQALLKIDFEFPAKCYTYNLQAAGTDNFAGTKRIVSDTFSITSHWSQFPVVNQQGRAVLRGIDFKNFSILESDGLSQLPVSSKIPTLMRALTNVRSRQLLSHGLYDAYTELAVIWVATADSQSSCNYAIFEHIPTGYWGISNEFDILSSAIIEDLFDTHRKVLVGTESGFVGQAFKPGLFSNFLPPSGLIQGTISGGSPTSIIKTATDLDFYTGTPGLVGNWCIITDANGEREQFARIATATTDTLTFDIFRSFTGGLSTRFEPTPVAGFKFYVGMIECRVAKYFDLGAPATDKRMEEIWLTALRGIAEPEDTLQLRFYSDRRGSYHQVIRDISRDPLPHVDPTGSVFVAKTNIPSFMLKTMGLEILERSYDNFRLINATIKFKKQTA